MPFDAAEQIGQLSELLWGARRGLGFLGGELLGARWPQAQVTILVGDVGRDHFAGDPIDEEVVRGVSTTDDGFAQTKGGIDGEHIGTAMDGIETKADARGIGRDHPLQHDGHLDLVVAKARLTAVGDRAFTVA